jgi:hypothetical protein
MDAETVRAKMMKQVDAARQSGMAGEYGWRFEVDAERHTAFITMRDRRRPKRTYVLRTVFDDFPARAPSYVFVDAQTRESTPDAWPPNVKHGDDALAGICTPGTREFHEKWHLNDATWPWNPDRLSFLDTLQRIHQLMERGA